MREVAGADKNLQDEIVTYRKLKLAEMGEFSSMYSKEEQTRIESIRDSWMVAETQKTTATKAELRKLDGALEDYFGDLDLKSAASTDGMLDDWKSLSKSAAQEFGSFASDLVTGKFESIGEAWDALWQTMLGTMVNTVAQMAAEYATAKIVEWAIDAVFHEGTTSVKEDETVALLQQGEMVVPRDDAAMIRDNLGGSGGIPASTIWCRHRMCMPQPATAVMAVSILAALAEELLV